MKEEEKEDIFYEILARLDKVVSLLTFSQKNEIRKLKDEEFKKSDLKKQIYDLCDGTNTVNDIINILNKPQPHISKLLLQMEDKGLLVSFKEGKKVYYEKALE